MLTVGTIVGKCICTLRHSCWKTCSTRCLKQDLPADTHASSRKTDLQRKKEKSHRGWHSIFQDHMDTKNGWTLPTWESQQSCYFCHVWATRFTKSAQIIWVFCLWLWWNWMRRIPGPIKPLLVPWNLLITESFLEDIFSTWLRIIFQNKVSCE